MASKAARPGVSSTAAAILGRLIGPEEPDLSPEAARSLLKLKFRPEDQERVDILSAKAREGTLAPAERAELEEYLRVADMLAILKSKARLSLKRDTADTGS